MPLNTTQSPYGTCQKLSDLLEAPFSEIVTNVVLVASYSVSTMKKEEFEVMTVSYYKRVCPSVGPSVRHALLFYDA